MRTAKTMPTGNVEGLLAVYCESGPNDFVNMFQLMKQFRRKYMHP
jgi:hypothetical protein